MNAMTQIEAPDLHAEIAGVELSPADYVAPTSENRYRRWFNGLSLDGKLKFLAVVPLAGLVFVGATAMAVLAGSDAQQSGLTMWLVGGCCALVTGVVLLALRQVLDDTVEPLRKLTGDMVRLASGDRDFRLAHLERKDEIGAL